jgi:nucleoside-diphosphate-sugar epimerase
LKVLVTGAGGFVGRALLRALEARHEAIAFDRELGGAPGIEGDLCDASVIARALATGCEAIVHLATVPGGAAELDPMLAWRVNVEAARSLLDAAARMPRPPFVVYASSIAVFGDPLPTPIDEDAPVAPTLLYGAHKAMMETWITTLVRRGSLRGVALRLPGIVARPAAPAGLKSAFLSDVFHALLHKRSIDLPVSSDSTTLLMSVDRVAGNLLHAIESGASGVITLPASFVRMSDLVASIARQTGADAALVRWRPDPAIEARFGRFPPLSTPRAEALGFSADHDRDELVRSALASL